MAAKNVISLREKKVVFSAYPEREFYFLSKKNWVCCREGTTERIYQRQRRGARVTWFDLLAEGLEPSIVTGDGSGLDKQLEQAYTLMENEKLRIEMEKFLVRPKKRL